METDMDCDNGCDAKAVRRVSSVRCSRDPADEWFLCEPCARAFDDGERRTAKRLNMVELARSICFPRAKP